MKTIGLCTIKPFSLDNLKDHLQGGDYQFISNITTTDEKIDFIIMDTSYLKANQRESSLLFKRGKIILISNDNDEVNINDYLCLYPLNHLIGGNGIAIEREISCILNKYAMNSIWGIRSYLTKDALCKTLTLSATTDVEATTDQMIQNFDYTDMFSASSDYIKLMANELLTNAFYDTIDDNTDRHEKIILNKEKTISFKMGKDRHSIVFSIEDQYGSLARETVIESIRRGMNERRPVQKKGGAKLGLYLIFSHANQFIVNRKKDTRTEIIAIIDCHKRYKYYKEKITSFHFYEDR